MGGVRLSEGDVLALLHKSNAGDLDAQVPQLACVPKVCALETESPVQPEEWGFPGEPKF